MCASRFYTFGIGPEACPHLVQGVAGAGRGQAYFIADDERMPVKVNIHLKFKPIPIWPSAFSRALGPSRVFTLSSDWFLAKFSFFFFFLIGCFDQPHCSGFSLDFQPFPNFLRKSSGSEIAM